MEAPEPEGAAVLNEDDIRIVSTGQQELEGAMRRANGNVRIDYGDLRLFADQIEYNQQTREVSAIGNVRFENRTSGETMSCERAEYNLGQETGRFYSVTGSAPARLETKPGVLTTSNPFYFEGEWAEKLKDRYILHNGFLTDCKPGSTWWRLKGSTFDVIPDDRAIAHGAWLYVKGVPIFYAPAFYKSLKKQPRRSGILTPNIGNSSLRGQTVGFGYFWAINRSYDATYRANWYTKRGFTHQLDFRGVPNERSNFSASLFGIGTDNPQQNNSEAGYVLTLTGRTRLGKGWEGRGEVRQLSSFRFRQEFTQSFDEAISSETHSIGFLTKHWSDYGFNFVAQRNINYQSNTAGDAITLRKLPEMQFLTREHAVGNLPLWVSLDSSFGLESRSQPLFQTRQFVQRADFAPRVMTSLHWAGISVAPSFGLRQTVYDSRLAPTNLAALGTPGSGSELPRVIGQNLVRSTRDIMVDIALPPLARIFKAPSWMNAGEQVKHVIEPRITYRYATGLNNFNQVLRFDEVDLVSNTHEVEFNVTNRLLARDGLGGVRDVLTWQVWYKRYFDPTFGGAVIPGHRNVVESSLDLTGYAFLNGPRHQSPVVSVFRVEGKVGVEWRTDYDPVRKQIVNSGLNLNSRIKKVSVAIGQYQLRTDPVLAPNSNQLRGQISYGSETRKGWNYGFATFYDYRRGAMPYSQSQVTYNTDCCGFSVQYRRINYEALPGVNQFRVAFVISNIGSFGTLKPQERIF